MPSSAPFAESPGVVAPADIGAAALLEIDKIRQLVDMMVANDLVEISLRDGDVEVSLRRPDGREGAALGVPLVTTVPAAAGSAAGSAAPPAPAVDAPPPQPPVNLAEIKSPMVGTFYAASDPDSPPFVDVGVHVTPETVVCIVEAMKVFNEIKAEMSATVEKVLVSNGQPVEYGQPLFLARPD